MGRTAVRWALVAAAVIVAHDGGGARAGEKPFQRGPDFQKRVDSAIAKGVAWLKSKPPQYGVSPDGLDDGPALAYHALRTCGVPAADSVAASYFSAVRRHYDVIGSPRDKKAGLPVHTSEYAMMCMALADHGEPLLVSDAFGERTYRLSAEERAWMTELVRILEDAQDSHGAWFLLADEAGQGRSADVDVGQTQLAILGLKAASRTSVRAKPTTWLKALQHYVDTQKSNGTDPGRGWGLIESTAGGISSIAICRSELFGDPKYSSSLDKRAGAGVRDAITWISANWFVAFDTIDRAHRLGTMRFEFYMAYAIERAGDLLHVERMGTHDWYGEGAEFLTAIQSADGSWGSDQPRATPGQSVAGPMGPEDIRASTCYALLFLARGTLPVLTHAFDDSDVNFTVVPSLSDADFGDFLDLVLARWRRIADPAVKDRLFVKATAVGPRIVAPLVERLASAKDDERAAAFALLKRATGLDNGYDPAAKDEARAPGIAKWQEWLAANEKTLHYDAAKGLLIP